MIAASNRFLFPLLAGLLVVSWSSGFVGIRLATEAASPFIVLLWRNLIAGLILLPFALLIGPRITGRALVQQMIFGFIGMFLYLASWALAIGWRVPTGLVALISDLVPLAIAALSQPLLGQALTARQWTGTMIGVAGVVLVSADSLSFGNAPLFAYLLPVAGMLLFAGMTVMQKRNGAINLPIHQSLAIQCMTAAPLYAVCAWPQGLAPPLDWHFILGIGWLVAVATFVCYSVYYVMLRLYPPARVVAAVYLSPPVTMLWAWAMFGEPLTIMMGIGLAVTLLGVALTSSR
jgi:drug/metabolite transporter (DMT)-like permease